MGQSASSDQKDIEDTTPECNTCDDKCDDTGEGEKKEHKCNYNTNLVGTVGLYNRHFIVCDGKSDWAQRKLEKDASSFVSKLYKEISAHGDATSLVKVTACSEPSGAGGVDVYVYPEKVKYVGLQDKDLPLLAKEHAAGGKIASSLNHVNVEDQFIVLVCTHGTRDKRCGRSGPQVVEKIQEIIDDRGLHDKIKVLGSSHIGGHKYAGVVTVYPQGDWYGYVAGRNVEPVIDSYVKEHHIHTDLWRGKMGMDKNEQRAFAGLAPSTKGEKKEKRER